LTLLAVGEWTAGLTVCSDPDQRQRAEPWWASCSPYPHICPKRQSAGAWYDAQSKEDMIIHS